MEESNSIKVGSNISLNGSSILQLNESNNFINAFTSSTTNIEDMWNISESLNPIDQLMAANYDFMPENHNTITATTDNELLSANTLGIMIKSEPLSPVSTNSSVCLSTQSTSNLDFNNRFNDVSINSPKDRDDLNWLHNYKLPMSLSESLLYNFELEMNSPVHQYSQQRQQQSRAKAMPIPNQNSYVDSFKFDHRPKLKKPRTKYTKEHIGHLEEAYELNQYPNYAVIDTLCNSLGIHKEKINIWFQNRRARDKRLMQKAKNDNRPETDAVTNMTYENVFPFKFQNCQQTNNPLIIDGHFQSFQMPAYDSF